MGLTSSMAWAVAKQLAAVSLSVSMVWKLFIQRKYLQSYLLHLHDQAQVIPGHVVVGVKSNGGPEGDLGQPRAPKVEMHQAQALETLQVPGVDGERVLITRLGRVPLLACLVNSPLQIQDQVGEGEHLLTYHF